MFIGGNDSNSPLFGTCIVAIDIHPLLLVYITCSRLHISCSCHCHCHCYFDFDFTFTFLFLYLPLLLHFLFLTIIAPIHTKVVFLSLFRPRHLSFLLFLIRSGFQITCWEARLQHFKERGGTNTKTA